MWGRLDNEPRTHVLTGGGEEADATSVEKSIEEPESEDNRRAGGHGGGTGLWVLRWIGGMENGERHASRKEMDDGELPRLPCTLRC
jgi:hypothetical protein